MQSNDFSIFDQIKRIINSHLPDYQIERIDVRQLSGLTNEIFKVTCEGKVSLIFRKFGGIINRDIENQIFKSLQPLNIGPKCIYACNKYRIEEYIENAKHPSLSELTGQSMLRECLELMSRYHQIEVQILKNRPLLIEQIFSVKYFSEIKKNKQKQNTQKFKQLFQQIQAEYQRIDQFRSQFIEQNPEEAKKKIKFCHNDLNNLNIFSQPKLIFIDYEYSAYNYLYYDIANFLNQTTINYQVKEFPCFKLERKLTVKEIQKAAKLYPEYYEGLEKDIIKGLVACNLYWAGWSIIMAKAQPQEGSFGSVEHGLVRMELYRHYKNLME